MTPADQERFRNAIAGLSNAMQREATVHTFNAYWIGLSDLAIGQVEAACAKAIRESDRMPTPAALRRLAGVADADAAAIVAWNAASKAVQEHGPYKHVDFDDAITNGVIRTLGGWPAFCEQFKGAEQEKWLRIEFVKHYKSLAPLEGRGQVFEGLPGLSTGMVIGGRLMERIPFRRVKTGLPPCDRRRIGNSAQQRALPTPNIKGVN